MSSKMNISGAIKSGSHFERANGRFGVGKSVDGTECSGQNQAGLGDTPRDAVLEPSDSVEVVAVSIGGSGNANVNYEMDGASHNDSFLNVNLPFPNPDAVQEFSVMTNNLSAVYGNATASATQPHSPSMAMQLVKRRHPACD